MPQEKLESADPCQPHPPGGGDHVQAEDVVVEEGEGGVRFFQAGQGVRFGIGDMFQEAADLPGRKVPGVAFAVEQDQAARPGGEPFPGSLLAEAVLDDLANEVKGAGGAPAGGTEVGMRGFRNRLRIISRVSVRPDRRAKKNK